ncbi:hypothetical protein [Streptosporangium canum]|uniref:hypothetical protein n=1 Tax=Streptosporangium canum TaxID=324952 RepID=UPI003795064C
MTTSGATTSEQRLERLRGLLAGTDGDSRAGRNLARTQKANVVFGATLHAADRLRQGEQLTELEDRLLQALQIVVPEEEIKDWGRVYRETVSARGTLAGVPEVITSRPVSEGYDFADLMKDLPAVAEEWMAQSNTALIDPEALAAGADFDSPEFIEGMREWGFGVSAPAVLTTPGKEQAAQDGERADPVYRVGLAFENFHVHRTVGDGWPNVRDEIRWISGGSSDMNEARPFLSEEFGGNTATAGKTPAFSLWNRSVFGGRTKVGLILSVACWEWDTGDGNDDSIGERLQDMNNNLFLNIAWAAIVEMSGSWLLGLLTEITSTAIKVIHLVARNDLSSARTFFLDQETLALLSKRGSAQWHFNGDGHHELKVKFTGDTVPFPSRPLEYVVYSGDTSSAPTALPWDSLTPPALASFNGKLHALFVRPSDQAVMWTTAPDGQTWSPPVRVHSWKTDFAPAMAVYRSKLYCVLVATNGNMVWSVNQNGTSWALTTQSRNTQLSQAPILAAWRDQLWMVHVGTDGRIWENYYDGTEPLWSRSVQWHPWLTDNPVALTTQGNTLWQAVRGKEGKQDRVDLTLCEHTGGWKDVSSPSGWRIACGPTLAFHNNKLWIFLPGMDGVLYASTRTGSTWSATRPVGAGATIKPKDEVAAAVHNGKLYVMYRR